jgi:hypothetical protein
MTDLTPLTSEELNAVDFCEEHWHRYRRFPTKQELGQFYKAPVDSFLSHPTVRFSLENRGITVPAEESDLPTGLSKIQVAAALKFLDVEDKRSLSTKLKEIGVTTAQWYGWMKSKRFKDFVIDNSASDFEDALHEAQMGLRRSMERGETQAIKLYYELTKRYNSNEGQIGNLRVVLAQIIETVQRHVTDAETLKLIANDFEAILGGGGVKPLAIEERTPDIKELL